MKLEKSLNGIVPALCYNKLFFLLPPLKDTKPKVGHCDLILLCFFFFIFIILNTKVALMFQSSYNQLYLMVPEKKLILMFLLFLVMAAILDS